MTILEDEIVTIVEEYPTDEMGIRKDYRGRTVKEEDQKMITVPFTVFKQALLNTIHLKALSSCGVYDLLTEKGMLPRLKEATEQHRNELDKLIKEISK